MDQSDLVEEILGGAARVHCKRPLPRLNGVSGPCIAEIPAGALRFKVLVFVSSNNVDVESLRKIASYRISEGADAAVIIVSADVDDTLRELAQALGVKIVTPTATPTTESVEEKHFIVEQVISPEDAERIFKTKILQSLRGILGGMLAGRRVEYIGMAHSHVWVRCYRATLHAADVVPEAIEAVETAVCFEMASGSLVGYEEGYGLAVSDVMVRLGELDDDVIDIIRYLSRISPASIAEIAEYLGSHERARVVLDLLAEFGFVELEPDETVRLAVPLPAGYTPLLSILENTNLEIEQGRPSCDIVIGTGEVAEKVDEIISSLGAVEEIINIYYPVHIGVFRKQKDSKKIDVATILDGITGERKEDLEEVIAGSPAIYKFDNIIERIVRGERIECVKSK